MATRKQSTRRNTKSDAQDTPVAPAKTKVDEPVVETETPSPAEPKKERQPSLTLSQRRALLRGQDAIATGDDVVTVASDFRALPYRHLVEVGYAVETDTLTFRLTDEGEARAAVVNPAYRAWAAGESVAGDPERPVAGTHRELPQSERTTVQAWIAHL